MSVTATRVPRPARLVAVVAGALLAAAATACSSAATGTPTRAPLGSLPVASYLQYVPGGTMPMLVDLSDLDEITADLLLEGDAGAAEPLRTITVSSGGVSYDDNRWDNGVALEPACLLPWYSYDAPTSPTPTLHAALTVTVDSTNEVSVCQTDSRPAAVPGTTGQTRAGVAGFGSKSFWMGRLPGDVLLASSYPDDSETATPKIADRIAAGQPATPSLADDPNVQQMITLAAGAARLSFGGDLLLGLPVDSGARQQVVTAQQRTGLTLPTPTLAGYAFLAANPAPVGAGSAGVDPGVGSAPTTGPSGGPASESRSPAAAPGASAPSGSRSSTVSKPSGTGRFITIYASADQAGVAARILDDIWGHHGSFAASHAVTTMVEGTAVVTDVSGISVRQMNFETLDLESYPGFAVTAGR